MNQPRDKIGRFATTGMSQQKLTDGRTHTSTEIAALKDWLSGTHTSLDSTTTPDASAAFNSAVNKLPKYSGEISRGTSMTRETLDKINAGTAINQSGSRSWSSSQSFARDWTERHTSGGKIPVLLVMSNSAGARDFRKFNSMQSEIIVHGQRKMSVVSKTLKNGIAIIRLKDA